MTSANTGYEARISPCHIVGLYATKEQNCTISFVGSTDNDFDTKESCDQVIAKIQELTHPGSAP